MTRAGDIARALCLAGLLLGTGCVTEEVIPPVLVRKEVDGKLRWVSTRRLKSAREDSRHGQRSELELQAAANKSPNDARAWWELGEHYERSRRYAHALKAYERMQRCIVREGKKEGRAYTGGLYLIGRMHVHLGQYREGVEYLRRVLALKPKSAKRAARFPSFRESHFLLGVVYYQHKEWRLAEEHLLAYERLLGNTFRSQGMLSRIEARLRPEALQAKARPLRIQRHKKDPPN